MLRLMPFRSHMGLTSQPVELSAQLPKALGLFEVVHVAAFPPVVIAGLTALVPENRMECFA